MKDYPAVSRPVAPERPRARHLEAPSASLRERVDVLILHARAAPEVLPAGASAELMTHIHLVRVRDQYTLL